MELVKFLPLTLSFLLMQDAKIGIGTHKNVLNAVLSGTLIMMSALLSMTSAKLMTQLLVYVSLASKVIL